MDDRKSKLVNRDRRRQIGGDKTVFYWRVRTCRDFGYTRRKTSTQGYWYARIVMKNGRVRSKRIAIADDILPADNINVMTFYQGLNHAEVWFLSQEDVAVPDRYEFEARDPFPTVPLPPPYTVGNAVVGYLKWRSNRMPPSGHPYSMFKHHVMDQLAHIPLDQLTVQTLTDWLHELAQKPKIISSGRLKGVQYGETSLDPEWIRKRRKSANSILSHLRAALRFAYNQGYVDTDKAWRRVRPFKRVNNSPSSTSLERDEILHLLRACPDHIGNVVKAGLVTGCRIGDLLRLRVSNVHLKTGVVRLHSSKTDRTISVSLSNEGIEFFASLIDGRKADEYLFVDLNGQSWNTRGISGEFLKCQRAARIKPTVTFTKIRHTFASQAVMAGLPMKAVATQLGHVDTRMVEGVYGHLTENFMTEEIRKKMPRLFS